MQLKTFKYTCHDEFFYFCLKVCTNVKNKYENKNILSFFKKSLDLQKNENHVVTFLYWSSVNFLNI